MQTQLQIIFNESLGTEYYGLHIAVSPSLSRSSSLSTIPWASHVPDSFEDIQGSRWRTFKQRLRYYIPVLGWLPRYSFKSQFKGDFVAGLSVACLLVPQVLSYAESLARVPPVNGLYAAFIATLVYSLLGTSKYLFCS